MIILWYSGGQQASMNWPVFVWGYGFIPVGGNLDGISSGDGGLGLSCGTGITHLRAQVGKDPGIDKIPYAAP